MCNLLTPDYLSIAVMQQGKEASPIIMSNKWFSPMRIGKLSF